MAREIINAIIYTEVDDNIGPNPLVWVPTNFPKEYMNYLGIKTITILTGEKGLVPESIVMLPFPSLNSKGLIKYLQWYDEKKRGQKGIASITMLFEEIDDVIFYKYMNYFIEPFEKLAQGIINLEKINAQKESIALELFKFKNYIEGLLEDLRKKEIEKYTAQAFPMHQKDAIDFKFKIIICGDQGVGKTSLILKFTENAFRRTYIPTVGVFVTDKIFKVDNHNIQLVLWDIAGQQKFELMRQQFYKGLDGAFLVFDLTEQKSFKNIVHWYNDLKKYATKFPNLIGYIVGNKSDLVDDIAIDDNEINSLNNTLNLKYIETSALTGENVYNAFFNLARSLYNLVIYS
ncbi:MAG: Rab family GTPase [Candidatus Thorarchaeota archaeon]